MDSVEVCLDRARLDTPPEEDSELCSAYPHVLMRVSRAAADPAYTLMLSHETLTMFRRCEGMKSKVSAWAVRSKTFAPSDQILTLMKGIADKCRCIEKYRQADVLLDPDPDDLPSELDGLNHGEQEDLRKIVLLCSLERSSPEPETRAGSAILLTRLASGEALQRDIAAPGEVVWDDGKSFHATIRVHCILAGDPEDLDRGLDPVGLWLTADGHCEQLTLAVNMEVEKEATANGIAHGRKWRFGCEFMSISSRYGFTADTRRARFLLKAMAATILDVPRDGLHRLHETEESPNDRFRFHEDGTKDIGMHCYIIGTNLRLNYWDCGDGSIEFGAAMDHNKNQLLPEC